MKSWISFLLLFLVFSMPVLTSFEVAEVYNSEASIAALEVEEAGEAADSTEAETEEIEKEIYFSSLSKVFLDSSDYYVFSRLPIFVSSYTPSFHIPPIA